MHNGNHLNYPCGMCWCEWHLKAYKKGKCLLIPYFIISVFLLVISCRSIAWHSLWLLSNLKQSVSVFTDYYKCKVYGAMRTFERQKILHASCTYPTPGKRHIVMFVSINIMMIPRTPRHIRNISKLRRFEVTQVYYFQWRPSSFSFSPVFPLVKLSDEWIDRYWQWRIQNLS